MPRFPYLAGMCLASVLALASIAPAQVETAGFANALGHPKQTGPQHPLVAGAPGQPVPLPVTLDGEAPGTGEESVSADAATAEPSVLPQQVHDQYEYVDQHEGAFRRLARLYQHLTAAKYCYCETFVRGQWSASFMTGYLVTPFNWFGIRLGPQGPRLDFLPLNVRLQRVVRGNNGERRWFKGSTEVVVELTNMPIVNGSGNFLIGSTISGRYNFSYTRRRIIPYVQFGGGVSYSDSWTGGAAATNLTSGFNFIIHAAYGSKFFINNRWSFDQETSFYHFSNSGIGGGPNVGVNGITGLFGLTYYFNRPR